MLTEKRAAIFVAVLGRIFDDVNDRSALFSEALCACRKERGLAGADGPADRAESAMRFSDIICARRHTERVEFGRCARKQANGKMVAVATFEDGDAQCARLFRVVYKCRSARANGSRSLMRVGKLDKLGDVVDGDFAVTDRHGLPVLADVRDRAGADMQIRNVAGMLFSRLDSRCNYGVNVVGNRRHAL